MKRVRINRPTRVLKCVFCDAVYATPLPLPPPGQSPDKSQEIYLLRCPKCGNRRF